MPEFAVLHLVLGGEIEARRSKTYTLPPMSAGNLTIDAKWTWDSPVSGHTGEDPETPREADAEFELLQNGAVVTSGKGRLVRAVSESEGWAIRVRGLTGPRELTIIVYYP